MDYQGLPPTDLHLAVEPDVAVAALLPLLQAARSRGWRRPRRPRRRAGADRRRAAETITPVSLAGGVARGDRQRARPASSARPLAWGGHAWEVAHPLDMLGGDGGGGIGGGPGMAVGAALALRGSGRLPVAVLGDGDFLMGVDRAVDRGALPHPAARRRLQQQLVLQRRAAPGPHGAPARAGRSPIAGSASASPTPSPISAMLARGQGADGFGPIRRPDELPRALRAAIDCVEAAASRSSMSGSSPATRRSMASIARGARMM